MLGVCLMPNRSVLTSWILATRPKTLVAAALPVIVGTVLAHVLTGSWIPMLGACTLLSALFLQIATNFFNDAIDFQKGADTADRIGPRRATVSGDASGRTVLIAGLLCLGVACALALPLIHARGWLILAIGMPSLFLCYGYTGGPWPLAYLGLGELFVVLFFGLIAVAGTVFVHSGQWLPEAMVAGLQTGLLSAVLIEINNLRDVDEDRAAQKHTLAVRFGPACGQCLLAFFLLAPYALGWFWVQRGHAQAGLWPCAVLPLSLLLLWLVAKSPPSVIYNRYLALGAVHFVLFEILFCLGLQA